MLDLFEDIGGEFFIPKKEFLEKLGGIKCFLFDWDGVFNDGYHPADHNSIFSEVDSMVLNLIRFSYWLHNDQKLPTTGIITGQNNEQAQFFAIREHLDFVMLGFKNKRVGLDQIKAEQSLQDHEISFVFDDVLDLSICQRAGLRFQISRPASPLFNHFVEENEWVDYRSASTDIQHGLREIGELIVAGMGNYQEVFNNRSGFTSLYQAYWNQRNEVSTAQIKSNIKGYL